MQDDATAWAWPWWAVMVAINAGNLLLCARAWRRTAGDPDRRYRTWMRVMGATFTLVGAYRAVFVSRYATQMAWFDSVANSSLLIRGLATFAEVAFSGQFALGACWA